jgi:enterochelin esterase-like enzyme
MSRSAAGPAHATALDDGAVEFALSDPERVYDRVRLHAGLGTLDPRPDLRWADGRWYVRAQLPPVHRVEYSFEVTRADDDAAHAHPGVLELPGYRAPTWLDEPGPEGRLEEVAATGITARLWSPRGIGHADEAALLVVQDGAAYAGAGLTHYLTVLARAGTPVRALLVDVERREQRYAVDDTYADALVVDLLPRVLAEHRTSAVVGAGASLGALAALHTAWRHPGTYAGLLLQSGAFFTARTDPQERSFERWDQVVRLADLVHTDPDARRLPATAVTCGTHEENAGNNRLLVRRLREVGVAVEHHEVADLHNVTAWRDAWHPALRDLLRQVGP